MTKRPEPKVGDTVKMRRGSKAGAVGVVAEIFKANGGRRMLRARCDYAEVFEMRGYLMEFDIVEVAQ